MAQRCRRAGSSVMPREGSKLSWQQHALNKQIWRALDSNAVFARTSLGLQERTWKTLYPQNARNIQGDYQHSGADFTLSSGRANISPCIHTRGAERGSHHMPIPAKLTCNMNPCGIIKASLVFTGFMFILHAVLKCFAGRGPELPAI